MRNIVSLRSLVSVLVAAVLPMSVWAAATRPEVQAQVDLAVAHAKKVGIAQATADFNNAPEWRANSMSLLYDDIKGNVLAASLNKKQVGKQTYDLKDSSGKEFVKEFISTAQKGGGWVDYEFINPETKQLEGRTMFVREVKDQGTFIGIAITK